MPTEILKKSIVSEIETILITKGEKEAVQAINEYAKAIESAKVKVKEHSDAASKSAKSLNEYEKSVEKTKKQLKEYVKEADKIEANAKKLINSSFKLSDIFGKVGDVVGTVNPRLGYFTRILGDIVDTARDVGSSVSKSFSAIGGASKGLITNVLSVGSAFGAVGVATGAFVSVALYSFFTRTGTGADLLSVKIAGLKQRFDNLLDTLAETGRALNEGDFAKAFSFNKRGGGVDPNVQAAEYVQRRKNFIEDRKRQLGSQLDDLELIKVRQKVLISEEKTSIEDFTKAQVALKAFDDARLKSGAIRLAVAQAELKVIQQEFNLRKNKDFTPEEKELLRAAEKKLKDVTNSTEEDAIFVNKTKLRLKNQKDAFIKQSADEREQRAKELAEQKAHQAKLIKAAEDLQKELDRLEIDTILRRIVPNKGELPFEEKELINRKIDDTIAYFTQIANDLKTEGIPFAVDPQINIDKSKELLKEQLALIPTPTIEVLIKVKEDKPLPLPGFAQPSSTGASRAKEARDLQEIEDERQRKLREDERKVIEGFVNVAKAFADAEVEKTDRLIEEQQRRIDATKEIADKGNAEQLQLEDERLNKLLQKREAAVKRQEALNKIEATSQSALNIVSLIGGIAKEAGTTSIYSAIIGGIALVATIGGLIASLKSTQGFVEGTEYVTGPGTSKSDSINARLSVGERVVPEPINKMLSGITNKDLPHYVMVGKLVEEASSRKVNYPKNADSTNDVLEKLLQVSMSNNKKVDDLQVYVQFDENSMIVRNERRSKHEIIKQRLIR